MALVDRVRNILLSPKTEWPVVANEATSAGTLISGYVVPLAAASAVAGLIGSIIFGAAVSAIIGVGGSLFASLTGAVIAFILSVCAVWVLSVIINFLAPSFGGQKSDTQAMKVAAYSMTAVFVAGLAAVIPILGGLVSLVGGLYGIFLMYLGLAPVMKNPEDKSPVYTIVVVVVTIVLGITLAVIMGLVGAAGIIGGGLLGGLTGGGSSTSSGTSYDPDSALGKLESLGKELEESAKKMEAAEKSGDANAQVNAALEGLGTLFGGGKRVDPVGIDALKPFVPDTFAGLAKTNSNAEKTGFAGLMVSKAEATYGDGSGKQVTLSISDSGGMSGLVGLAGWVGVQGEQENDQGSERTHKVDGRLVHERVSKTGGSNEYGVVIGERFMVTAEGRGVDLAALKSAVSDLDLRKLEAMKDVGVQK